MRMTSLALRVLMIAGLLLVLYGLGQSFLRLGTVLRVLGIAALTAYLVNPMVRRLESRGMSRAMGIAAVFLTFLTITSSVFYLLVPVAQHQAAQVGEQVQQFVGGRDDHIARLQVVLEEKLPTGMMEGRDLKQEADSLLQDVTGQAVGIVTSLLLAIASNLIYVFLLPMMVFMMLSDGPAVVRHVIGSVPNQYAEVVHRLLYRIDDQLGGYIRGILIVAVCVGTVGTVGLWIVGMKYFFIIGPLMGLLNIIPVFGPMIGMGVAGVAMLFQTGEPGSMVGAILVGLAGQILDNVAFTPVAVSRSVDLHPLLVLVMTLAGGELLGLIGLLLAVPATATAKVVLQAIREARQHQGVRLHGAPTTVEAGAVT